MKRRTYLYALLFSILAAAVAAAQTGGRARGMRFVPDVPGQFYNLTEYADPLGFDITTTPDPSTCRHYQGLARAEGADGTPFFFATRSGNTPFPPGEIGCFDSPRETRNGHLVVFRLDSRDKNGERLRSNRMARGRHTDQTAPDEALDRATIYFTFTGGDPDSPDPAKWPGLVLRDGPTGLPPPRAYQHPGGMQMVGNILAVALESPRQTGPHSACLACAQTGDRASCDLCTNYERAPDPTLIQFYDVSDPEAPVFKSQFVPRKANGETLTKAGVVGITPLPNGRYLMVVTGGDNETWFFYRSTGTDLSSRTLEWVPVDTADGPKVDDPHQTLNFLREKDINGDLYIAAARGHVELGPFYKDRERIDLYRVECETDNCDPGEEISITVRFNGKRISPFPSSGGKQLASLAAASTFYVSPSGELIFYAGEHDNDGPNATMKAGEWRHANVVRPDSPTLLPTASLDGPFFVDEGSAVTLTGRGEQPITKAFLQLFHETNFGPFYLTATYDDREREEFEELFAYEQFNFPIIHSDQARSWKWFAPQGCSIQAVDREGTEVDELKTLTNASSVQEDADLSLVMHDGGTDDIDREIDRITFGPDCDSYYSAPVSLFWDLDDDKSYETAGNSAPFSAAGLSGPSVRRIPVEARHSSGGAAGPGYAEVTIRNVAPQLSQFRLTDAAGNQVGSAVPFVLTGQPVTAAANFGDPGTPDRQTAEVAWGDGTAETQAAFSSFDEAFGDGAGSLAHNHRFSAPGTYTVRVTVTDSDGDADVESAAVRVLTPEQAILEVIGMIDTAIAGAADADVRASLRHARQALAGTNDHSNNGALQQLRSGNRIAAAAFTQTGATWLEKAGEEGADVAVPLALLEQIAAALSGG